MQQKARTLIGVMSVVKRPYKIRIEVRRSSDGYSTTIVVPSSAEKYLPKIEAKLRNAGYRYTVSTDHYGFTHIHLPGLRFYDVLYVRKLVEDALSIQKEEAVAVVV